MSNQLYYRFLYISIFARQKPRKTVSGVEICHAKGVACGTPEWYNILKRGETEG